MNDKIVPEKNIKNNTQEGIVIETLPGVNFKVKLDNGDEVIKLMLLAVTTLPWAIPSLVIGMPLWIVGSNRLKRIREKNSAVPEPTAMISPETKTYGLGLRWRM